MCNYIEKTSNFIKTYRKCCILLDKLQLVRCYHRRLCSSSASFSSEAGKKKDVSGPFPTAYDPKNVESQWYEWWLERGFFKPSENDVKNTFSMVLPPPNVTGDLHIGHSLAVTIQDVLIRWHRAKGFNCVWIPGYDHAGIATQVVVEKKLKSETGLDRHRIGRTEFRNEVHRWTDQRITNIRKQLQSLGSSLDWSRETFTMNESYTKAVTEAFVRVHQYGLITRRKSLINWCCQLRSTISDIEVDHVLVTGRDTYKDPGYDVPIKGELIEFAYPLEGSRDEIVISTTRPETIFGDVAVAVNPKDDRYGHLKDKNVVHPFDGRILPIIFDDSVDQKFGTGCLKVTPGHSHEDFRLAEKHNLPLLNVLDERGHIVTSVAKFNGLHRFSARNAVVKELERLGLFRGRRNHEMMLPICSRSGGIVEPLLKSQWFFDTSQMTRDIAHDLITGTLIIDPEHSRKDVSHWLEISKDSKWCLSRQLWWGHRIPAYRLKSENTDRDGTWIVARSSEEALQLARQKFGSELESDDLVQDEDVLDTWFSSALFPFVVFGWPENTKSLRTYYPLSLMETGRDILFFWVVRMLMLGRLLTDTLPFTKVLAHGLVYDAIGRKMSKSLGNVVDPSHLIDGISLEGLRSRNVEYHRDGYISAEELTKTQTALKKNFPNGIPECGADALRFALCSQDLKDQTVSIDIRYMHSCRTFCNKIWQACRFYLISKEKVHVSFRRLSEIRPHLSLLDQWMLSQLYNMVAECDVHFSAGDLHLVTIAIKRFWYFQFCDVYVEAVKPIFNSQQPSSSAVEAALSIMRNCIQVGVVAMSPFMPFLSEELFQRLELSSSSKPSVSVCVAAYPRPVDWKEYHDPQLDVDFRKVLNVVHELRRFKRQFGISGSTRPQVFMKTNVVNEHLKWEEVLFTLNTLGRCEVHLIDTMPFFDDGIMLLNQSSTQYELAVLLSGVVDVTKSIVEFERQREKTSKELERRMSALENSATDDINVTATKEKLREIENYLVQMNQMLSKSNS